MIFINADARYKLESETQKKMLNIDIDNSNYINKYLTKTKYDIISYQFSIHYLFFESLTF